MPSLNARFNHVRLAIKRGLRSTRKKLSKPAVRLAAIGLAGLYQGYMALVWYTSRIESYGMARAVNAVTKHRNIVVALWHDNVVLAPRTCRIFRPTTLASRSDIGDVITAILHTQKYHVFRGGSSRGKARRVPVLQQLSDHIKQRKEVLLALTVDGSSGPARVMKPGIIALACETQAPIFATHIACKPAIKLPTWDRTRIPLPFGRIVMILEGPIICDANQIDADEFRRLREQGQLLLDDTAERAQQCLETRQMPPPNPALELDPAYGDRDIRVGRSILKPDEPPPNPRLITDP